MRVATVLAPNPGAFTLDGTRTYVLEGRVVIDPGPAIDSHVNSILEQLGGPRPVVLLTHRHPDHVPAALALRDRAGAEVRGPAGSGVPLDVVLSDGDLVEVGTVRLRVVATPGHTSEHVCFLGDGGELFSGDTILGSGTTAILPPDGSMASYMASLHRLRELGPEIIYPGHGPVLRNACEAIDAYIAHRLMREREIEEAIRAGAVSVGQIRERIYESLDARLHAAAESQILAHVDHLRERGIVRVGGGGGLELETSGR